MSDKPLPNSEFLLYQTEDGRTRIQCRFENETVCLTQALMAELFEIGVNTVNYHLKAIFSEGELRPEATIRVYRIVRSEGGRRITRQIEHYNLEAVLAVGFRVRSHRGTQFRQWAIGRLNEYLVKGFTMDDERLKNPPGKGHKDYFDEQLERIRDIRSSERRFYQKVLDIYATSVDYTPNTEVSQQFFATVPISPNGYPKRNEKSDNRFFPIELLGMPQEPPAALFQMAGDACATFIFFTGAARLPGDFIQHPINKASGIGGAEAFREFDGFIHGDLRRCVGIKDFIGA